MPRVNKGYTINTIKRKERIVNENKNEGLGVTEVAFFDVVPQRIAMRTRGRSQRGSKYNWIHVRIERLKENQAVRFTLINKSTANGAQASINGTYTGTGDKRKRFVEAPEGFAYRTTTEPTSDDPDGMFYLWVTLVRKEATPHN